MSDFKPPVQEMLFILYDALGFTHDEIDRDTAGAVLDEAAKLAVEVLAPINKSADEQGAKLENGNVKTAAGFRGAYKSYCDGGWNALPFDPEYGGQGLPWALAFPVQEMWQGANMSFGLCPLLNQGTVEGILSHGSTAQKNYYLPKLISGEWTGTMNLTEAQAGSDIGLIRSRAEKQNDGSYKISGQKIFITYGDHDLSENIIHLVLARTMDAPNDVRGISLFIVPKILENGAKNSVQCIGLEHKLGINASPTCTMDFDDATGYLIGEENRGLRYMFTTMNNARLSVGLQGVAIAERAYQHANIYAHDRIQGRAFGNNKDRVAIANHADVIRMLMEMKSLTLAGRIMTYSAAMELDKAMLGDDAARVRADFLTPIVKSWCTDMAVSVTSTGIQIHGGMGFIEETGAAQYYRDARILPIYEGTNGIQAADLVFRKVILDNGAVAKAYIDEMAGGIAQTYLDGLISATDKILSLAKRNDLDEIAGLSTLYLNAFGYALGGMFIGKAMQEYNASADADFTKVGEFYNRNIMPMVSASISAILD